MPLYSFTSPTGETTDLFFSMKEAPKVGETIVDDGVRWTRVFTVPNARIAETIDPFSKKDYLRKTAGKKENFGDMWDRSAELSAKRAARTGTDKVKEKYFDDYKKRTGGVEHSERQREKALKTAQDANNSKALREMGIKVKINV